VLINVNYGQRLYHAGRPEEAAAQLRGVMALDSSFIVANEFLGTIYLFQGRPAEAVPLLERSIDQARHSINVALLGYAYRHVA
jgi:Tfp pilus assembly protein PilF